MPCSHRQCHTALGCEHVITRPSLTLVTADDLWLYRHSSCALSHYDKRVEADNLLECMTRCVDEQSFNCVSLDFHVATTPEAQPQCYLRQQSYQEISYLFEDVDYCYNMYRVDDGDYMFSYALHDVLNRWLIRRVHWEGVHRLNRYDTCTLCTPSCTCTTTYLCCPPFIWFLRP